MVCGTGSLILVFNYVIGYLWSKDVKRNVRLAGNGNNYTYDQVGIILVFS